MKKESAGILLYRCKHDFPEVLLVHPGGPFWKNKDTGAWSIPKGEFEKDEQQLDAAKREVAEETGMKVVGDFVALMPVKQKNGKTIFAWALQGDFNTSELKSNEFELEWPPKSGQKMSFPEIDKAGWFNLKEAKSKIIEGQLPLVTELEVKLSKGSNR